MISIMLVLDRLLDSGHVWPWLFIVSSLCKSVVWTKWKQSVHAMNSVIAQDTELKRNATITDRLITVILLGARQLNMWVFWMHVCELHWSHRKFLDSKLETLHSCQAVVNKREFWTAVKRQWVFLTDDILTCHHRKSKVLLRNLTMAAFHSSISLSRASATMGQQAQHQDT